MSDFDIKSLPFCLECGSLLYMANKALIQCTACGRSREMSDFDNRVTLSHSHPYTYQKPKYNTMKPDHTTQKGAKINEKCPQCGHSEMYFHTMQLRSVDEGQTVFYNCEKCKHSFSVNS